MEIKRDRYLNALINRKDNGSVKVITGLRRCGKTYLVKNLFMELFVLSQHYFTMDTVTLLHVNGVWRFRDHFQELLKQ